MNVTGRIIREDGSGPPGGSTMSEDELRDPQAMMRPLSWSNWLLRTMILEYSRRYRVLEGRADPTPFDPWRIADPIELKAWIKRKQDGRAEREKQKKKDDQKKKEKQKHGAKVHGNTGGADLNQPKL